MCKSLMGPRSYDVQVRATMHRWNRQHMMTTKKGYTMDKYNDMPVDDRVQHQALYPMMTTLKF